MAFKIGSNTVIDNSGYHQSGISNNNSTISGIGYRNAGGQDIGELYKPITYTDQLGNCRGILPPGNCQGQNTWTAPQTAWYNWQLTNYTGIKSINQNPNNFQQQGNPGRNCNTQTQYWPYDQNNGYYNDLTQLTYLYDAYLVLYDRIKQLDYARGYSHCNCATNYTHPTRGSVLNCLQNCNCNCNC